MLNKSSITILLLLVHFFSYAQPTSRSPWGKPAYSSLEGTREFGINAGLTAFMGDLGGTHGKGEPFSKDLNGISMRPHLGLSFSYYTAPWFKVMASFNYTTITGADSVIKTKVHQSMGRFERNLSFRSRLQELSVSGEIYPLQLLNSSQRETLLKPYIGLGIGGFHFNPKAELNGQWIALKPLRLEGEGFTEYPNSKPYSLYQFYIPLTFGFKYRLDDQLSIAFSTTFRKTFTDYLDDVSKIYVDPALFDKYLTPANATLAKQLYYRGIDATPPKPGSNRTWSTMNDSYTSLFLSLYINLGQKKDPEARRNRFDDRVIKVRHYRYGYY